MQMQKTSIQRLEDSQDTADRKLNGRMHYSPAETFFHSGGDYGYFPSETTPASEITSEYNRVYFS